MEKILTDTLYHYLQDKLLASDNSFFSSAHEFLELGLNLNQFKVAKSRLVEMGVLELQDTGNGLTFKLKKEHSPVC